MYVAVTLVDMQCAVRLASLTASSNSRSPSSVRFLITTQMVRAVDFHRLSLLTAKLVHVEERIETAVLWQGFAGNNSHTGINDQQT